MEYKRRRLADLKPYENNPRNNDDAVDDIVESIKQCSYISPIVVDENNEILAGHTRFKALQKLGYSECDVIVASDLTEEQKRKYRLYDNKAGEIAQWDPTKLLQELRDLDFNGYDFGQPVEKKREEEDGPGIRLFTCPCCGEVFEE